MSIVFLNFRIKNNTLKIIKKESEKMLERIRENFYIGV